MAAPAPGAEGSRPDFNFLAKARLRGQLPPLVPVSRMFYSKDFLSLQWVGAGRYEQLLVERFGAASFALAFALDGGRLALVPRRWSLLGIPMRVFLLPQGASFEYEEAGRLHFDVEISAPVVGMIVGCRGSLVGGSV